MMGQMGTPAPIPRSAGVEAFLEGAPGCMKGDCGPETRGNGSQGEVQTLRAEGQATILTDSQSPLRRGEGPGSQAIAGCTGICQAEKCLLRDSLFPKLLCGPGTSFTQPTFLEHLLCAGPHAPQSRTESDPDRTAPHSLAEGDFWLLAVRPRDDGRVERTDP